jgi:uncharacterized protein (TIGR03435 family)
MRRCWLLVAIASALRGQAVEGPMFEAASLKKLQQGAVLHPLFGGPGTPTPTRVEMHLWVSELMQKAFDKNPSEFVNTEKLPQDLYEFIGVLPAGAAKDEYRAMLRNLLIERFHLRYHAETREVKHYEISVARGGVKMKEASGAPTSSDSSAATKYSIQEGYVTFPPGVTSPVYGNGPRFSVQRVNSTVEEFAQQMKEQWLHAAVEDKTGLNGKYDFRLRFTAAPNQESETSEPDLATAMREQLGLILREVKGPAEVVVIDSIDREPTPN